MANEGQKSPFSGGDQDAVSELEKLLDDAVRLRMQADVPLGALCSSGVRPDQPAGRRLRDRRRAGSSYGVRDPRRQDRRVAARAASRRAAGALASETSAQGPGLLTSPGRLHTVAARR